MISGLLTEVLDQGFGKALQHLKDLGRCLWGEPTHRRQVLQASYQKTLLRFMDLLVVLGPHNLCKELQARGEEVQDCIGVHSHTYQQRA